MWHQVLLRWLLTDLCLLHFIFLISEKVAQKSRGIEILKYIEIFKKFPGKCLWWSWFSVNLQSNPNRLLRIKISSLQQWCGFSTNVYEQAEIRIDFYLKRGSWSKHMKVWELFQWIYYKMLFSIQKIFFTEFQNSHASQGGKIGGSKRALSNSLVALFSLPNRHLIVQNSYGDTRTMCEICWKLTINPAGIYLHKLNNRNARTRCEISTVSRGKFGQTGTI